MVSVCPSDPCHVSNAIFESSRHFVFDTYIAALTSTWARQRDNIIQFFILI